MNKVRKHGKETAGFSLVELIIVIAIMAALIAIVAPTYLKYVDKARRASDEDTLGTVVRAVQVAASDPDYAFAGKTVVLAGNGGNLTIMANEDDNNVASLTTVNTLGDFVAQTLQTQTIQLKSADGVKYERFEVTLSSDAKTVTYKINGESDNVSLDYAYWNR